jgi:type II secretory pathway component PulJ
VKRRFSMLELIAALAIAGFILNSYIATMTHTRERLREMTQQQRAISVLDNTVARLEAETEIDIASLRGLLDHEFDAMEIPRKSELKTELSEQPDFVILRIVYGVRVLASVELAR